MSDDFDTKKRILEAMKKLAEDGKLPTTIDIPRKFEAEMCLLGENEVGTDLARAIVISGPRKAIKDQGNTIFGMTVTWDAQEFKISGE